MIPMYTHLWFDFIENSVIQKQSSQELEKLEVQTDYGKYNCNRMSFMQRKRLS